MAQWEYLTAPTLTHAAKPVLDICAGPAYGWSPNSHTAAFGLTR